VVLQKEEGVEMPEGIVSVSLVDALSSVSVQPRCLPDAVSDLTSLASLHIWRMS